MLVCLPLRPFALLLLFMGSPQLVTKDMIPPVWLLTPEQEQEWIVHVAPRLEGADPGSLRRMVVLELPDVGLAWEYRAAYVNAAKRRDDLVIPVITSQEQWHGREQQAMEVVRRLVQGDAPAIAFRAVAILKE